MDIHRRKNQFFIIVDVDVVVVVLGQFIADMLIFLDIRIFNDLG